MSSQYYEYSKKPSGNPYGSQNPEAWKSSQAREASEQGHSSRHGNDSCSTRKAENESSGMEGGAGSERNGESGSGRVGYQKIEPKAEKREKLVQARENGERVYDEWKETSSRRFFNEKGTLGGWGGSESQAREIQARKSRQGKYDRYFREDERRKKEKERQDQEIQKKKDAARQQALRNEERKKAAASRDQEEMRRKRLERLS